MGNQNKTFHVVGSVWAGQRGHLWGTENEEVFAGIERGGISTEPVWRKMLSAREGLLCAAKNDENLNSGESDSGETNCISTPHVFKRFLFKNVLRFYSVERGVG